MATARYCCGAITRCIVWPPNTGKSFLALDFALSVGSNHHGIADPVVHGPVVYVAAEGAGGLSMRVEAWEKLHECEASNVHFLPEAVNLLESADIAELLISLRGLPFAPQLIVIDTLARCLTGGDENSSKDVGQFVAKLDTLRTAFNCAVIVVHHSTKSANAVERGSSALRGAADTMLFLSDDSRGIILSCEKQKDAAPFQAQFMRLEIAELANGKTSCVIRRMLTKEEKSTVGKYHKAIIKILTEWQTGYTYADLSNLFIEETGASRSTFKRAIGELVEQEIVVKTELGLYKLTGGGV
jgi:hypothetical protein